MFNYDWPIINTIDDILPAIKDREEFIVAEREWGTVINYMINFIDTFPRIDTKDDKLNIHYALRRECRGIKFDLDGKIIARPFHKFFNLNERPETMDTNIDWSRNFNILQKLDGSMLHPILVNDEIIWCTKMGITDVSNQASEFVDNNSKYDYFTEKMIKDGFTPIFEWCSRKQRIVIDYPNDKLTLLALRNMITGEYINYHALKFIAKQYNMPIVEPFIGSFNNISDFVDDVTDRQEEEGYVLRFNTGHCVKIKNLWYLQLHRVKEALRFEKDVIALILRNTYDDVKSFMDDKGIDRLDRFADDLIGNINKTAERLMWVVIATRDNVGESQKKFAKQILDDHKSEAHLLFSIDKGLDPYEVVSNLILKETGSGPRVDKVRQYFGDIYWKDY